MDEYIQSKGCVFVYVWVCANVCVCVCVFVCVHPRTLNPIVLRRINTDEQGLWSPANVNPMHTTNSTRYSITR